MACVFLEEVERIERGGEETTNMRRKTSRRRTITKTRRRM